MSDTTLNVLHLLIPFVTVFLGIMSLSSFMMRRYDKLIKWSIIWIFFGIATFFLPPAKKTLESVKPKIVSAKPIPSPNINRDPSAVSPVPLSGHLPWEAMGFVSAIIMIILVVIVGIIFIVPYTRKKAISHSENVSAWKELLNRYEEIRAQWISYEMDMSKIIDMPLMTDMREPVIISLHKALKTASSLAPKFSSKELAYKPIANSAFLKAVTDLEVTLHSAEQAARKIAWTKFTREERKSLSTAKQMLSLAMDSGASPAERQAAYRRVLKELQGIIEFPEKARLEIEARHHLSLVS